ncbi:MAG: precorrin-3B C(17)-methyltransferase [Dehalococcoidales bacterium]|nr:precorrin-3B C(17)-methyltransferase [Dehalococcoidales bacterium]
MVIENKNGENTAVIALTKKGSSLGQRLHKLIPGSDLYLPDKFAIGNGEKVYSFSGSISELIREAFRRYNFLVLIMASGIAVRSIATELRDKKTDPGVVVIDEAGKNCISLVSGHLGGTNEMAVYIASLIDARPVITTASDVSCTISADLLGREYGWIIEDASHLTEASAAIVNGEPVGIYQDAGQFEWSPENLPDNFTVYSLLEELAQSGPAAALVITDRIMDDTILSRLPKTIVVYRPKSLVIGLGCNKNTGAAEIEKAVCQTLLDNRLSGRSVRLLATIDIKRNEGGILKYAGKYGLPIEYHSRDNLKKTKFPSKPSAAVKKHVGTPSVCEGAALLSSRAKELIVPKRKFNRSVTVAIARYTEPEEGKGKLFLVGIGPGSHDDMTFKAREVIGMCDTIVGYRTYISQIENLTVGKKVISTGMGSEVERVRKAVDLARTGKKVCLISGGDTGIYGMAALAYEVTADTSDTEIEIEIIPGITAVVAAAARLGSPVSVDFAVISLSDYLISIDDIYKRLELAAQGDFIIALYNPRSKKRGLYLEDARDIILGYRDPLTPVGLVSNACRENEVKFITDLEHMLDYDTDMNTIVIIGNSTTFVSGDRMITPRGYSIKYAIR